MRVLVGFGTLETQKFEIISESWRKCFSSKRKRSPKKKQKHPSDITGHAADKGVTISYSGGYPCGEQGARHRSIVQVVCAEGGAVIRSTEASQDGCTMTVQVAGAAGCGTKTDYVPGSDESGGSGIGAGGIILIILAVCVVLYVAVGSVINWKLRGRSTFADVFPNWSLWSEIPGLVKDGVMFIGHGCKKGDWVSV